MIRFFLERHLLVHVLTAAVVLVGLYVLSQAQREGFPAVTMNEITVSAELPGASPLDVESQLTLPIEEALDGVDGIEAHHSVSTDSLSMTTVELYDDFGPSEVEEMEREIQKALDAIDDFPADMEKPPSLFRFNPAKMHILEIALSGPRPRLREVARDLERRLGEIDGVAEVVKVGYGDPEIVVLVDPVRARAQGVTLEEVITALKQRNVASTGGTLQSHPEQKQVVLSGQYHDLQEVEDTILRFGGANGGVLRLRDVARVKRAERETGMRLHREGEPSLHLVVKKRAKSDILDTVDALKLVLDAYEWPEGVEYGLYNDQSIMTRNRLQVVITNGIGGVVLVLGVLLLFLSGRVAGWVAFGVPFCLLGVAALLPLVGITINMVSLAGFVLVIGIVVDDAIIIAERIAFHMEKGLAPKEAALAGTKEMAIPVVGSSLTTILAFSPLFLLGGIPGKFAWAIPAIVILTLAVSLFECFFILPAHLTAGRTPKPRPKARWLLRVEASYTRFLERVLGRSGLIVAGFFSLLVVSVLYAANSMSVTLFPQDDSDAVYLKIDAPVGTPIERTEAIARGIESQVPAIVGPDLDGITARIGHQNRLALERNTGSADHEALVSVFLTEGRDHGARAWIARIKDELHVPAEVEVLYEARQVGPPIGAPVTVHVASNVDDVRRRAAAEVLDHLERMDGLVDITTDARPGVRQVDLRLDHERLALKNISVEQVSRTVKAAFFGLPVTERIDLDENEKIRVRFEDSARTDLSLLLSMPIRSQDGRTHALRDVVDAVEVDALSAINHRDGVRTTTVMADLAPEGGATASSVANRLDAELLPRLDGAEPGLDVYISGEASQSRETLGEMPFVLGLAFIGILMIVTLLTGSVTQAAFVVAAIPLGLIGVIWAYAAHDLPISLFALLGVTGLSGVVVNDSIVMVTALDRAGAGTTVSAVADIVAEVSTAATERLRPVVLTTLTTVAGVMPTAYGLGGRDALLSPMSLALGYGLLFASTITLVLVPALYVIRRRIEARVRR